MLTVQVDKSGIILSQTMKGASTFVVSITTEVLNQLENNKHQLHYAVAIKSLKLIVPQLLVQYNFNSQALVLAASPYLAEFWVTLNGSRSPHTCKTWCYKPREMIRNGFVMSIQTKCGTYSISLVASPFKKSTLRLPA